MEPRDASLGALYATHAPAAVRLAGRITGDRVLAEDLVQEAFVRLATRFPDLRDPGAFGAYLWTAVTNLARSHFRRVSLERRWLERESGCWVMRDWVSLPAGVVTLAERFGGVEVSATSFELMCAHVRRLIAPFVARVAARDGSPRPDHLLGTSGTVTTIAGVQMRLRRYDRSRVDGSWLMNAEIDEVVARLLAMSYDERAASPCIGRDRADLVLAGCAILDEIRRAFPASRLRVADRGLREGILAHLMKEDGAYGGN